MDLWAQRSQNLNTSDFFRELSKNGLFWKASKKQRIRFEVGEDLNCFLEQV